MDLKLTEDQRQIQQTARDFCERELVSKAASRNATGEFPEQELRALAKLGFMAIAVPEEFGGAGSGTQVCSLVLQEIGRADASVAVAVSVTNMVAELVSRFGTLQQKKTVLPSVASGDAVCGAFALSEPQAGSDPSAMATTAKKTPNGWIVNGTKQWISHGDKAGFLIVWAVTDPKAGSRGISAFIVPKGTPGLSVIGKEQKMGLNGSTTVQLSFDDMELDDDALLGSEGQGFKLAMAALDGGRIGISSQALGIATAAVKHSVQYAKERVQFGVPLIKHQAIANMIADMGTSLEAGTLMTRHAAWLKDNDKPYSKEAAMTKVFVTEGACSICDTAIQIHGGSGYTRDLPLERLYRDARVTRIYEGTSEIQRIVIARHLIKEASR